MSHALADPELHPFGMGEVLARLRDEFPDLSVSKVRFLEREGIVTPARTNGGARRFNEDDIERLVACLRMQRDDYLPLRVIKERLDAGPVLERRQRMIDLVLERNTFGCPQQGRRQAGLRRNRNARVDQPVEEECLACVSRAEELVDALLGVL